ncbi:hypothetical protein [Paraburkholderia sp. RL17-337-BIB-A]|uniref:hypothetical protein n=1 Tax=Paraburkholderia sp. RL17-337-BIB-A TaxID=3031636 RepID=UPI0038B77558
MSQYAPVSAAMAIDTWRAPSTRGRQPPSQPYQNGSAKTGGAGKGNVVVCQQSGRELQWQRKFGVAGIASKGSGMMTSDEALAFKVLERFATDRIPGLSKK